MAETTRTLSDARRAYNQAYEDWLDADSKRSRAWDEYDMSLLRGVEPDVIMAFRVIANYRTEQVTLVEIRLERCSDELTDARARAHRALNDRG